MECEGIFLLLGILALWASLQAVSGRGEEVECPPPTLHCVWSFPPLCGPRRPCAPGKTCCYHQCRFQCLDLLKEKAGTCPPDPVRCSQPQPNECGRDYECSAQLKCCHWRCARRCVEPVQE
ncbi:WAP four-disulfide core domain protein 5 precursor [Alligator mississippiensis]|uniref:WAP four-disulfide core domain protein 5 n=1 Tax=Alligator mississippiensis TaxID=8496 RepID=A0A151N5Y6_ALLMI|nr:WAP four-disulfide core domain protein 5 precursor [Alligator mississippiensis]